MNPQYDIIVPSLIQEIWTRIRPRNPANSANKAKKFWFFKRYTSSSSLTTTGLLTRAADMSDFFNDYGFF